MEEDGNRIDVCIHYTKDSYTKGLKVSSGTTAPKKGELKPDFSESFVCSRAKERAQALYVCFLIHAQEGEATG